MAKIYSYRVIKPHIEEYRQQTNPLGPLQETGGIFLKFVC